MKLYIFLFITSLLIGNSNTTKNSFTLSTTYNSNQWIDLNWPSVSGASYYEIEGVEHPNSGNGTIVIETYSNSARAYPTGDPTGEFRTFVPNELGFAHFKVFAYDSNDDLIATSNIISYGIELITQPCGSFCNSPVGLCNIDIDVTQGGPIQCE